MLVLTTGWGGSGKSSKLIKDYHAVKSDSKIVLTADCTLDINKGGVSSRDGKRVNAMGYKAFLENSTMPKRFNFIFIDEFQFISKKDIGAIMARGKGVFFIYGLTLPLNKESCIEFITGISDIHYHLPKRCDICDVEEAVKAKYGGRVPNNRYDKNNWDYVCDGEKCIN